MVHFIEYSPDQPNTVTPNPSIKRRILRLPRFLKSKKFWIRFGGICFVVAIVGYLLLIRPVLEVVDAIQETRTTAGRLQTAVSAQDVLTADKELPVLEKNLEAVRLRIEYFGFTEFLPLLSDYYRDTRHLLLAAGYGLEAGKVITESLVPFADVLGLKGGASGTAEEKLQKVIEVMPKIAPRTDEVAAKLKLARVELETVNPTRYPENFQLPFSSSGIQLRGTLTSAKELVTLISDFMPEAKDVLLYAPVGLGSPTPKTYIVIFQNDKELRPTGGFLTAYAFTNINKGKATTEKTDDIYNLDASIPNKPRAPLPILKYMKLVPDWNLRDSNMSPDFRVSMNTFESMYRKSPQYRANNGYIGMDTHFLVSLLKLTGPVKTASTGDTFTAENVVPKLETYAQKVILNDANRKGFMGELMTEILKRLTQSKSDQWADIINTLITSANEKHVLLYSKDAEVNTLLEKYNWAGRIKDYNGDYLHINDTNFAGAKANLYITQKIMQDITIDGDGTATKKVTVEVTNPAKYDGWLNGPYRDWIRMYVPKGSEFISAEGGEVKTLVTADELGKTMFESFFTARPLGTSSSNKATWSVTYKLPFKLTGKEIKILQQKQPGVDGPDLTISINGQVKVSEQLRTDKEFTLSF